MNWRQGCQRQKQSLAHGLASISSRYIRIDMIIVYIIYVTLCNHPEVTRIDGKYTYACYIYIYSIFGTTRNVGLNQLFRACDLPSSKMYLTLMQLAGMNLPSFRHVVMAWKNFNDTQYDRIHWLYHRYHLKELIYIPKICVHVSCILYYIYIRCKSQYWFEESQQQMTKNTPLLTRRQSCQWRAGSKGLIFGESNWLQRTLPSSPGPIAFCIVRSWNVSEAREDEKLRKKQEVRGLVGWCIYTYIYIYIVQEIHA